MPGPDLASAPAPYLDALVRQAPDEVRDRLDALGDISIDEHNLATMRQRQLRDPGVAAGSVEHFNDDAPGFAGSPPVAVRVHRERDADQPRPAIISIHGGGYVIGTHLGDDGRFERWAPELGVVGVSVGYRLAPETPFPGPLEDCYAALRWTHEHANQLGVDRDRVGIIGGSAGGGLAAGLALMARDRAEFPIAFQALNYPMLDDRLNTTSSQAGAPLWGPQTNQFGWRSYLRAIDGEIPGYAVPARSTDLAGLPPTLIAVGNLDGLLDEDLDYARRLIQAGVPTDLHVYADAPHAYDSLLPDTAVADRARRTLEDWLAAHLLPPVDRARAGRSPSQ